MSAFGLLPLLNRLDALTKRVEELIAVLKGEAPPIPEVPTVITVTKILYNNRYTVFSLDTTTARTNEPLGLLEILKKHGVEYASYMVVLAVGGGFTYQVNSKSESLCTAAVGDEWSEFEISEVYITNPSVVGTALIHIEFRVGAE
jgi:hypothetical protein